MNNIEEENILLLRNLKDAGCGSGIVENFLQLQQEGKTKEQLRLLSRHRRTLLQQIHDRQNKIDCLDYLIYTLKKPNVPNRRK